MTRVTQQRTRQALLVTGEPLDILELPERIQLFNELGQPLSIPIGLRREVELTTEELSAADDTGKLATREAGGRESGAWAMGIGVMMSAIAVSRPCRVRFYVDEASRDFDADRDRFTDPMDYPEVGLTPDHGCLSEFLFLSFLFMKSIPADYLVSGGGEPQIYYNIENYDLDDGPVIVNLTIKDIEQ